HDAVWLRDQGLDQLGFLGAHAEVIEVKADVAAVKDTHHAAFAKHRGQRRDTQVYAAAFDHQLDAAVLRHAGLGDVELAEDFDAADQRRRQFFGRVFHGQQGAVHAVAYLEAVLERLKVDVAAAVANRGSEQEVEQFHDLRGIRIIRVHTD